MFNYQGNGWADHVAIVTQVDANGNIVTLSGDWNGQSGSEAYFASTASVIVNQPAYPGVQGSYAGVIGMTISGFISPVGGNTPPPPPPPPPSSSCSVQSDGLLHCSNQAHSAMYAQSTFQSGVVDYLESTNSWFKCWGTGDLHPGGNTTWYYTQGDDNGNWGWVPAVDLGTDSSLDANPTAYGLPACN